LYPQPQEAFGGKANHDWCSLIDKGEMTKDKEYVLLLLVWEWKPVTNPNLNSLPFAESQWRRYHRIESLPTLCTNWSSPAVTTLLKSPGELLWSIPTHRRKWSINVEKRSEEWQSLIRSLTTIMQEPGSIYNSRAQIRNS
jgi:hypothetical protein